MRQEEPLIYAMPERDDLEERARLARNYAAMSDGELQTLALNSARSLAADAAWEAFGRRVDDRNLELPVQPVRAANRQFDLRKLVVIRQFRDLPEALLAKGSLESTGIECYLRDDNLVRLDWFVSNFIGGVKLCVHPEDVADAKGCSMNRFWKDFTSRESASTKIPDALSASLSTSIFRSLIVRSPTSARFFACRCRCSGRRGAVMVVMRSGKRKKIRKMRQRVESAKPLRMTSSVSSASESAGSSSRVNQRASAASLAACKFPPIL